MKKLNKNQKKRLALTGMLVILAILNDMINKFLPDSRIRFWLKVGLIIIILILCYVLYLLDKPNN